MDSEKGTGMEWRGFRAVFQGADGPTIVRDGLKLQITYRVLWPNETSRVFISDASRTDAQLRVERWQA